MGVILIRIKSFCTPIISFGIARNFFIKYVALYRIFEFLFFKRVNCVPPRAFKYVTDVYHSWPLNKRSWMLHERFYGHETAWNVGLYWARYTIWYLCNITFSFTLQKRKIRVTITRKKPLGIIQCLFMKKYC